jgi:hypothetical protein
MGRDGSFAEDHPGVAAAGEIDDGGGGGAGGGTAVYDEGEFVAELLTDTVCGGALGMTEEVGGGCGDGQAEASDDGAGNGGFGNAEGEVAGVGGDAQGKFAAGFDDDRERTRPKFFSEAIKGSVEVAGELVGLGYFGDEERERLVAGTGFEFVDAIDGSEIDGVDGETVEGVGWKRYDVAAVETGDDTVDESWLGFIGMDAEGFGRQSAGSCGWGYPLCICAKSSSDAT